MRSSTHPNMTIIIDPETKSISIDCSSALDHLNVFFPEWRDWELIFASEQPELN